MTASSLVGFTDALLAPGPAPDRADGLGLYGWLVGSWELDALYHLEDGTTRPSRGEVHAAWALEGRAVQDVWIVPARGWHTTVPPVWGAFYGTTLRVYDPGIDAWHILWADPVRQLYRRMIGRAQGRDIVQDGTDETGAPVRWSFTAITPDSFHWCAERSPDGGATWQRIVDYDARRVAA